MGEYREDGDIVGVVRKVCERMCLKKMRGSFKDIPNVESIPLAVERRMEWERQRKIREREKFNTPFSKEGGKNKMAALQKQKDNLSPKGSLQTLEGMEKYDSYEPANLLTPTRTGPSKALAGLAVPAEFAEPFPFAQFFGWGIILFRYFLIGHGCALSHWLANPSFQTKC